MLSPCEWSQARQQLILDLFPEVFGDGGSSDGAAVEDRDEDVGDDPLDVPQQVLRLPCINEACPCYVIVSKYLYKMFFAIQVLGVHVLKG